MTVIADKLKAIVGSEHVIEDPAEIVPFGSDRTTLWQANPACVVLPGSCGEVRDIVRLANQLDFALVPSGGRTGLSGGAMATNGEVVVAMDRMNRIVDYDDVDQILCCQAGVVVQEIQEFAEQQGLFYPVDYASAGSARIGGGAATNAGGIHVIRYGGTREQVRGLKVVTGTGELLDLNRGLVKNNCGPDLRHLFIASEGILGIICEVTLALQPQPRPSRVMVLAVPECKTLLDIFILARKKLSLSAYEFFTRPALEKVIDHTGAGDPFARAGDFYALLEFDAPDDNDGDILAFYQQCDDNGWIADGVISQSTGQAASLWKLREDISESLAPHRPLKNDIAVRISRLPAFIEALEKLLADGFPDLECLWFGHLGDGNIHLNILKPRAWSDDRFANSAPAISDAIFKKVKDFGGSISAEHGIGLLKKPHLAYGLSQMEIDLIRQIKAVFDPKGIMNPGKVI